MTWRPADSGEQIMRPVNSELDLSPWPARDAGHRAAAPINVGTGSTTEGSTALLNYVFTVTVPSGQSSYGLRVPGVQGVTWETAEMKAPALQVTVGS